MAAASVSSPTSALGALSVASERSASPGSPKRKQAELDTISEVSSATASALDQLQAPPQPAADRRARRTSVRVSADGQAIQQQARARNSCDAIPWRNSLAHSPLARAQLPRVRVSREFLDDFFAKFNIDGTQESNKASVAEKLRHTLGTPKLEGMVEAVAEAVLSHVEANGELQEARQGVFDERERPLNAEGLGVAVTLDAVQRWLWSILSPLSLDPECLIIALALVERAVSGAGGLSLTTHTWRPCTLCAIALASKTWYDSAIFNVDFSSRLPHCQLTHMNAMEAAFLKALDFKTNVTMTLYAKYFFALQDVLTYKNGASSTRRATWSPGGGY